MVCTFNWPFAKELDSGLPMAYQVKFAIVLLNKFNYIFTLLENYGICRKIENYSVIV
jgi:hypothetical protein